MNYPGRLHHNTPGWVSDDALFHVRIRCDPRQHPPLTDASLIEPLLSSVQNYHTTARWCCTLFLIMPDHVHALLRLPGAPGMSETVRSWKQGCARLQNVRWQDGYFDHRLRNDSKARDAFAYIRRNPVAKGLCIKEEDWLHQWSAFGDEILS